MSKILRDKLGRAPRLLEIHNATGSRLYRIIPQAKYMAEQGWDVKVRGLKSGQTGGVKDTELMWADIVVVEMTYSPSFIKTIKKYGGKVVFELDDLMHKVTPRHYSYKEMSWWRKFLTYYCIFKTDAVTCTVQTLKDYYKWFSPNIHVLPNLLDLDFWEKPYLPNTSGKIRIGWIGGTSHNEDLEFIAPVLERITRKYPNVKFICTGFGGTSAPNKWVEFNYGKNFFENLPPEQYEFSLGAPFEAFPSKIASLRLDIAIAPVVENMFSKAKSECKFGEYSINRIPGVFSKFLYQSVIEKETGLTAEENEEDWFDKICYLIENEKERKRIGENAYSWVKENWDFKKQGWRWKELYESLLKD